MNPARSSVLRAGIAAALLLCVLAAGPAQTPEPEPTAQDTILLRVGGDDVSGTTLAPKIAGRFLTSRGAATVTIEPAQPPWTSRIVGRLPDHRHIIVLIRDSTCADGFRMLDRGLVDVALSGRRITPAEAKQLAHLGNMESDAASYPMAASAVTIAVNRAHYLRSISFQQLRAIYSGRMTDWSQLGVAAGPIHVLARVQGSGAVDLLDRYVMGDTPYGSRIRTFATFAGLRAALLRDPQAIGYLPMDGTDDLNVVRLSERNRVAPFPDEYSVRSGDYPFTLTLTLYRSPNNTDGAVADFFHEATSVQSEIDTLFAGFTRLRPALLVPDPQDAPPEYRILARRAMRVSSTIRFNAGTFDIDEEAARELDSLASYLRFLHVPGDKLRHIAFSNGTGDAAKDRAISRQLGIVVLNELKRRRVYPGDLLSLGSGAPLASDMLAAGRRLNRRVETWIEPCSYVRNTVSPPSGATSAAQGDRCI